VSVQLALDTARIAVRAGTAVYNDVDAYCLAWLRNLIAEGHIAPGSIDVRSIETLTPADVAGPGQRHFFAGIAGWSLALRLAGVGDSADVWTGSCPCQPFSQAGIGAGFDDERHLWPAWFALIRECRPAVVFGEQVAGPDGRLWLDAVSTDLEGAGYAVGAACLPAAGLGAPHRRERLFVVAYTDVRGLAARIGPAGEAEPGWGCAGELANPEGERRRARRPPASPLRRQTESRGHGAAGSVVDTGGARRGRDAGGAAGAQGGGESPRAAARAERHQPLAPSAARGAWSDAEWIRCTDEKWRPTKPGVRPLAHGIHGRVGAVHAGGNAIVPQVAAVFIRAAIAASPAIARALGVA
jgi:DNA (cytosine-5)-methyltransferase 1